MGEAITAPCVACDEPVLIDKEAWDQCKEPLAVCADCQKLHDPKMLILVYRLRCQIAGLAHELACVKQGLEADIKRLYNAQQDVEEALQKNPT